jgi:hypothetical protein
MHSIRRQTDAHDHGSRGLGRHWSGGRLLSEWESAQNLEDHSKLLVESFAVRERREAHERTNKTPLFDYDHMARAARAARPFTFLASISMADEKRTAPSSSRVSNPEAGGPQLSSTMTADFASGQLPYSTGTKETPISSSATTLPGARGITATSFRLRDVIRFNVGAGILRDIRARAPWYWSDWKDAWNYRVLPATALVFFAK